MSQGKCDIVSLRRRFSLKIHEKQDTQKVQWKEIIEDFMIDVGEVEINLSEKAEIVQTSSSQPVGYEHWKTYF